MTKFQLLTAYSSDAQLIDGKTLVIESPELMDRFARVTEYKAWHVKATELGVAFTRLDGEDFDVHDLIGVLVTDPQLSKV